ncbi:MAG: hypothetical protein OXD32_04810, partial [Endozoicomonadaceae bacterium]|nr:hypothetical protein [Endozoicomonadaceae bacterium]
RNNNIYFHVYSNNDGNKVKFITDRHCITKQQPYKTPDGSQLPFNSDTLTDDKTNSRITIRAGRHSSKKTVKCLSENMLSGENFTNHFTFRHVPGKLNFAVQGTLIINQVAFEQIILAQGLSGSRNNWWFGGRYCKLFDSSNGIFSKYPQNAATCMSDTGEPWCFVRGVTLTHKLLKFPVPSRTSVNVIAATKGKCSTELFNQWVNPS